MYRKLLTGVLLIFPLLFCGVCGAEMSGVTARRLAVTEKKNLEANIATYQARVDELAFDLQKLEREREWLHMRSMRYSDRGEPVPFSMKKTEETTRARIVRWEMEKDRLEEYVQSHLKRLSELSEEVKKGNNGKLPAWWRPDPFLKRYAPEEPPEKVKKEAASKPVASGTGAKGLKKEIAYKVRTTGIDQWVELSEEDGVLKLETRLPILFGPGKSSLSKEYGRFFKKLAGVLKPYPVKVEVEGSADRSRAGKSSSNFTLGAKRADSVVRAMVKYGMNPSAFTIRSKGEFSEGRTGKKKDPMMRRARVTVYFSKTG